MKKELSYEEEKVLLNKLTSMIIDLPHLDDCTCSKPNYITIPVHCVQVSEDNVKWFSEIWELIQKIPSMHKVVRTASHGISHARMIMLPAYDAEFITGTRKGEKFCAGGELVIGTCDGWWRIQLRPVELQEDNKGRKITGKMAFYKLVKLLEKDNINICQYAITDKMVAKKINDATERYIIKAENEADFGKTFESAHHIDFHSSFPAGLVNTHPEFKKVITELYNKRHDDEMNKAILNLSIGYMHSVHIGYRFAQLSQDAINDNNKRVKEITKRLKKSGRKVLLYNTDGVWYTGEVYHGEGEGDNLGEWRNDHVNCKFRMKSQGSYEFIENDIYYPVVRGSTTLDKEKPRTEWVWGDIFKATLIKFELITDDEGIQRFIPVRDKE